MNQTCRDCFNNTEKDNLRYIRGYYLCFKCYVLALHNRIKTFNEIDSKLKDNAHTILNILEQTGLLIKIPNNLSISPNEDSILFEFWYSLINDKDGIIKYLLIELYVDNDIVVLSRDTDKKGYSTRKAWNTGLENLERLIIENFIDIA